MSVFNLQPEESRSLNWMAWRRFMVYESSNIRARETARIRRKKLYSKMSNISYSIDCGEVTLPQLKVSTRREDNSKEDREALNMQNCGAIKEFLKSTGKNLHQYKPTRNMYNNVVTKILRSSRKEAKTYDKRPRISPDYKRGRLNSLIREPHLISHSEVKRSKFKSYLTDSTYS